jgi:uncharacterized protein (TIGR00725 family)
MKDPIARPKVGVMGSANDTLLPGEKARLAEMAERLGATLAARDCVCVTGATTGLPELVSRAVRNHKGLTIGISPAMSLEEHVNLYKLPADCAEVIIFTGFGLKGRNVINIRSSDIVIIFGGAMGALNEFTIAYDEGKIIGVLEGSGGIADHINEIIRFTAKPTRARIFFDQSADSLLDVCLQALATDA